MSPHTSLRRAEDEAVRHWNLRQFPHSNFKCDSIPDTSGVIYWYANITTVFYRIVDRGIVEWTRENRTTKKALARIRLL